MDVYVQTNKEEEKQKDEFINSYKGSYHRIVYMIWQWWVTSMPNTGYKMCMGCQGLGQMDENGEPFTDTYTSKTINI